MGIEDRDYFRERKFSWTTGELIEPEKNLKPLQPLKPVPIDRHPINANRPPDIPIWIVLSVVVAGFCAAFWLLGHLR